MTTEIKLSKKEIEAILKKKFPRTKSIKWELSSRSVGYGNDSDEVFSLKECILKVQK